MKLTIQSYQPVAVWKWNLLPASEASPADQAAKLDDKLNSLEPAGEGEEEEDVCGICRVAFEGCCPECKKPGEDCPLSASASSRLVKSLRRRLYADSALTRSRLRLTLRSLRHLPTRLSYEPDCAWQL